MNIWGKVIGGAAGFAIGGPIGAYWEQLLDMQLIQKFFLRIFQMMKTIKALFSQLE